MGYLLISNFYVTERPDQMTEHIEEKWRQLQEVGVDLGDPVGPEQEVGSEGASQQYQHGTIYRHERLGTFVVQGLMPAKYAEVGSSLLGFPTSDETETDDGLYPAQYFERGAIIQLRGTNPVCIQGDFYQAWRQAGGELGEWGYPVADQVEVAGGQVVYFERGCMWKMNSPEGAADGTQIMRCRFYPPLLGRPTLADPDEALRLESILKWELPEGGESAPGDIPPDLFEQVWGSVVLSPVTAPGTHSSDVPLRAERSSHSESGFAHVDLVAERGAASDRTLYNIALRLPGQEPYELAPHSVYMKSAWDYFGIIHATDLHISRRVEDFERRLRELGLEEAAEKCNCFNDNFRDLIRYANHLHDEGLADVILMTGDVTDYVFEQDDNRAGGGNFYFFEQLVRGLWPSHGDREIEELRIPIFTILGNHDYRPNGYSLLSDLDIGDEGKWDWWPDWLYAPAKCDNINGYAAHNLTMEEALALQGGQKERLDTPAAYEVVRVDPNSLKYYHERINDRLSYSIEMGKHRVVMIDSRWEVGIVEGTFRDFLKFALNKLDKDARDWLAQHPNCVGFEDDELQMVRDALSQGDQDGIVIVGVHAPPINPSGDEWPHYFRETEHPTADEVETVGYLMRRDRKTFFPKERHKQPVDPSSVYPDWVRTGTPYFKQGGIEDLLDYGIAKGSTEAFLEMCVGQGVPRKLDLVLCGHIHSNVEYRLDWDPEKRFLFHTDFYTENPATYYPTLSVRDPVTGEYNLDRESYTRVDVSIKQDASPGAAPVPVGDAHARLDIPAYKSPLNSAGDPRQWWDQRRPLVMQTASLGSMDRDQRVEMPVPSFQGFRVITVEDDTISKIRYVTLRDLRKNGFMMPWEENVKRKT